MFYLTAGVGVLKYALNDDKVIISNRAVTYLEGYIEVLLRCF